MLTVASYNMRKGVGSDGVRRPERVLDVLCEVDADIVALQEADRRFGARASALPPAMIERCTDYRHVPLGRRDDSLGWHGNAILVRKGAKVRAHDHIDIPTLEPRGAVCADIELSGLKLRVVGMHLDLSGLRRRRQARTILHALDSKPAMPTVLMGDLNEWRPHGGCIGDFAHHYRIAATGPTFHARRPVGRLDRIMVSPQLHVVACGVHHSPRARHASDHLPVWARVEPA